MPYLSKKTKNIFIVLTSILIISCASKYLNTKQPAIAAEACAIERKHCFLQHRSLTTDGTESEIVGYYFLGRAGDGVYALKGSVTLEVKNIVIEEVKFLYLTFFFFKDDTVVHEETVRLSGPVGKHLEFHKTIKTDHEIGSTAWVTYGWRATE